MKGPLSLMKMDAVAKFWRTMRLRYGERDARNRATARDWTDFLDGLADAGLITEAQRKWKAPTKKWRKELKGD